LIFQYILIFWRVESIHTHAYIYTHKIAFTPTWFKRSAFAIGWNVYACGTYWSFEYSNTWVMVWKVESIQTHAYSTYDLPLPRPDLSEALLQLDGTSTPAVRIDHLNIRIYFDILKSGKHSNTRI
jgi:hypothetical protein